MRNFFAALWSAGAAATRSLFSALKTHWSPILLTGGVALFAIYLLVDKNIFVPRTEGTIFIETPQIYTRERLVNDRFVQESWLRDVLKVEPDFSPPEIVSITDQKNMDIRVGGTERPKSVADVPGGQGSESAKTQSNGTTPGIARPQIPPSVLFQLRNAYRELIRSHLIENQLDDRHDIRGTTIYMLKFDVAIVPGNNTRKRAFVRVRITRDAPAKDAEPVKQTAKAPAQGDDDCPAESEGSKTRPNSTRPNSAQEYFTYYLDHQCEFIEYSSGEDHPTTLDFDLYNQWIASLQDRLTAALRDLLHRFDSNNFRPGEYYEFLSMLAESRDQDWFSYWANSLSQLQHEREENRKTLGTDLPLVAALDHRFDFLAKLILIAAVDGTAVDFDKLQNILGGHLPLPEPADESRMRDQLMRYAIRHIGMAVVGDPNFRKEKSEAIGDVSVATIVSRTLDRFVAMRLESPRGGRTLPEIKLEQRSLTLYSFKRQEYDDLVMKKQDVQCPGRSNDKFESLFIPFGNYQEKTAGSRAEDFAVFRPYTSDYFETAWVPGYILKANNLRHAFSKEKNLELPAYGKCLASAKTTLMPIGFLNFVNSVVDIQTYTYATLPRIDLLVTETGTDSAQSEGLSVDAPGAGASGAISNYYRRIERAVEPKTSIVGFSGAICSRAGSATCSTDPPAPDELNFGWVLSPPGVAKNPGDVLVYRPMQPTQRSLSALITVPTWWKRAHLQVTTGWVHDDGGFDERRVQPYDIPLPIDFESLDAILTEPGRRDSRKPSIALEKMPENIQVQACARAEILVPGHRLWRSSVVVLGGQRADEVTVLPDMRGIIAIFKEVAAKREWEEGDNAVRKLQVWTSEGAAQEVGVKIGQGGPCKDGSAADPRPAPDNLHPPK